MNAAIVCVGRLKENWQKEACAEYVKRLGRYGSLEVIEVPDQPEPARPNEALERRVVEREGAELLRRIRPADFVVALCIDGEAPDSIGFSRRMDEWKRLGRRTAFAIGGSLGLSQAVLRRADYRLSFSNMTFPHALMRVILLEQLYRAARISAGERYHK